MLKFVVSICVLLATPVFSATHKLPEDEPIFTIEVPDEWQTKEVGESVQATAPGDPVHVLIVPPEGSKINETMGEAMRYIRGTGGIVVKPDSIKNEPGKLNGMEVQQLSWEAKDKNGDVKIQFTIVSLAQTKSVLVACWGPPKAEQKHEAELKKILQSIKKT
jgi:predicted Zn-dependent protease